MRNIFAHCSKGEIHNSQKLFLVRSKTIWKVQNGFEPTEGQGIRDAGVNKIESIKYQRVKRGHLF